MGRFQAMLLCALPWLTTAAFADELIQSGRWKVSSKTEMNGAAMPPQAKDRCLTPDDTADVGKTFGPAIGTVNSTCERTEFAANGRSLKWRLLCKGQIDMDISGDFAFDSSQHYTALVLTKGWMAGTLINDIRTELEGERVGDCP